MNVHSSKSSPSHVGGLGAPATHAKVGLVVSDPLNRFEDMDTALETPFEDTHELGADEFEGSEDAQHG